MEYAIEHTLRIAAWATHIVCCKTTFPCHLISLGKYRRGNVTCLRRGTEYCGATAYAFERKFAPTLVPLRQTYVTVLPVDWIIDVASNGHTGLVVAHFRSAVNKQNSTVRFLNRRIRNQATGYRRKSMSLAVLVPYRNRTQHLHTFLAYMVPFLRQQQRLFIFGWPSRQI